MGVNLTVKAPGAGTGISLSYVPRIGGGHISDGGTGHAAGDTGSRGLDVVVDFVNVSQPHFGFRWGMAAETEIIAEKCPEANSHSCDGAGRLHDNPYGGSTYMTMKLGPLSI